MSFSQGILNFVELYKLDYKLVVRIFACCQIDTK